MKDNQYQQSANITCQLDGKRCIFASCNECYKTDSERKAMAEITEKKRRRRSSKFLLIAWLCLGLAIVMAFIGFVFLLSGAPELFTDCLYAFSALSIIGCISYSKR